MAFEQLESRDLFAVLTVGPTGSFATIQSAVDNARSGDAIEIATGTYQESVDLSRMGSAVSSRPGDLTLRAAGPNVVVSSVQGAAIANTAAFRGNISISGLTIEATFDTSGLDSGIALANITGDVSLFDNSFNSIVDDGLRVQGLTGQLTIDNNRFESTGDGPTDQGIFVQSVLGQVVISANAFIDVKHAAIVINQGAAAQTEYLLEDNSFTGDSSFFATTQIGVQVSLAGNAIVDLALVDNYFSDLGAQGIDVEVTGNVQLHSLWQRNVVQNVKGTEAAEVILRDSVVAKLGFEQNSFGDLFGNGLTIEANQSARADIVALENLFLSVGDESNDTALRLLTSSTSTGTIRATFESNDFVTVAGDSLVIEAGGTSNLTASLQNNFLSEVNVQGGTAAVRLEQTVGAQGQMSVALLDNSVLDNADTAYSLRARGNGGFRLEGEGSSAEAAIAANNEGTPIDTTGQITLIAPGTLDSALPQILGGTGWLDENHDGVRQPEELSAIDVRLTLRSASGSPAAWTTLSTSLGDYAFVGFVPGSYTVTIEPVEGYTLAPARQGTDPTADSDFAPTTRQASATLTSPPTVVTLDFGLWGNWQNSVDPLDVDGDGVVAPIDALLIINDLNSTGARALPLPVPPSAAPPYLDTDGDNFVAPIDVLLVINRINENSSSGGEGESMLSVEAISSEWTDLLAGDWLDARARRKRLA